MIFENINIYFPLGNTAVQVDLENMNCFWRNYYVHVDHDTNPRFVSISYTKYTGGMYIGSGNVL